MSKQRRVPLLKLRKISSEAIPNFFYAKKPDDYNPRTVLIASFRARIQPKDNPDDYNPDDYNPNDYDPDDYDSEGVA